MTNGSGNGQRGIIRVPIGAVSAMNQRSTKSAPPPASPAPPTPPAPPELPLKPTEIEGGASTDQRAASTPPVGQPVAVGATPPAPVGYVESCLAQGLIPMTDPSIVSIDKAIETVFEQAGVPRLGGASGDLGWSSFSVYQRCPYLYYRTYINPFVPKDEQIKSPALEIGSLVHVLLAVRYEHMRDPTYPFTPEKIYNALLATRANAEVLMESWRLYQGYDIRWEADYLIPIVAEYHTVDPETRQSCRYDLIAKVTEAQPGIMPGTWCVEHKTLGRFDDTGLNGWRNDGEIIGQLMLWKRLKLDKKFGKLQGVLVNIIGKQKNQQFHRTPVPVELWKHKEHAKDLKVWRGLRLLCESMDTWPRARANCVGRYQCGLFEHCADRET